MQSKVNEKYSILIRKTLEGEFYKKFIGGSFMKRKKLLSLLLAVATAATLLVGCGGEEQKAPETTNTVDTEASAEPELDEKTIQIWLCGEKQQDTEKVWDAFNEMLKEYVPNTTVEFSIFPQSEYNEKFQQMLASGEAVDVAWAASWVTGNVNDAIKDGNYMALDDLVAEYGQGITDVLTQDVMDYHKKADGKLYYLVNWQGLANAKRGLYVMTDVAKLAGDTWLEDTEKAMDKYWNQNGTPDDLQKIFDQVALYCEAAKEAGKLGAGIPFTTFMGYTYNTNLSNAVTPKNNVGVANGDNTFTVVDGQQTEYYRVFAKNMADFYKKGYIRQDSASVDTTTLHSPSEGVIDENTYCLEFSEIFGTHKAEEYTAKWGLDVSTVEIEKNAMLVKGEATINIIPYCADEAERAMMVMNAIYTTPELYQTLIWGIEGEHWTDNGDGTVNYTGGGTGSDAVYGYDNWKMGSCINGLTTQTMTPGYYEEMKELEKTAYITPFKNFVFDATGLEDVISALAAVGSEYEAQINGGYHGDNWETVLDKFIAERKAAGVDKLIEAYQEQVNAYAAENGITGF